MAAEHEEARAGDGVPSVEVVSGLMPASAPGSDSEATSLLRVEVVYARPDRAWRVHLCMAPGSTALQAYEASGLRVQIAELGQTEPDLGVFSHPVLPDRLLRDGDRVEIYRPLLIDPKDARRKRAAQR